MDEKIIVIDNFFEKHEMSECSKIINNVSWSYGARSVENVGYRFWSSNLYGYTSLVKTSIDNIHKYFKFKRKFSVLRVHANGQTYGQDGIFHRDDEKDGYYTLLVYTSDITRENIDNIGGFTQFKIDDTIVNVEPFKNRAVFFKSHTLHRGLGPFRPTDHLRVSIAFKLQEDCTSSLKK
jgi:hypothetical protein